MKAITRFITENYKKFRGGGGRRLSAREAQPARVDYVDLMKGLTILWIIWIHSDHPDFGAYRNPLFFFASGIFFKFSDIRTFFSKRWRMLIIPFLLFYVLSIPFRYIVDLWDTRSFTAFDWGRILELFSIEARHDYLSLNVPLWFLLTLFWIHAFSFIIFRLPRWAIAMLSVVSLVFFKELYENFPTLFMINNALAWFGYFGFGYILGKPLIRFLNSARRKVLLFLACLSVFTACIWAQRQGIGEISGETISEGIIGRANQIVFIIGFMTFFSFFNGWKKLEILRFFGKNSLIVLGAHLWVLVPIERAMFRLLRFHSPWVGLGMSVATAIILIPIIIWMNRHIPSLVGKGPKPVPSTN